MTDASDAISAVTSVVSAATTVIDIIKLLRAVRDAVVTTGDQRLDSWVNGEVRDAAIGRLPEVETKCQELVAAGIDVKIADLAHIVNHFARGWSTAADPKKRKLLEDAFVRSFDRELYESGLLNVLWERLERVSYGDLFLLRELLEVHKNGEALQKRRAELLMGHNESLNAFHATNLVDANLCVASRGDVSTCRPSELGKRMRELAWGQLPEPGAAVDSEKE